MTSEEIRAAIKRLREYDSLTPTVYDVTGVFMDDGLFGTYEDSLALRDRLIELLEQADSDDWSNEYLREHGLVSLPKDANGEYVHLGDEMRWPNGYACDVVGIGHGVFFYNDCGVVQRTSASNKTHRRRTVKDVLRKFAQVWLEAKDEDDVIDDYAAILHEVMKDD